MHRLVVSVVVGCALIAVVAAAPAEATGGEGEAWPSFTESSSCGSQRVSTPLAVKPGGFGTETLLRGPFADMFGRSVKDLRSDLVRWEIPGSSEVLLAHERMQPALTLLDDVITRFQESEDAYTIRNKTTYATAARTIAGSVRISRHTFGTAFDINSHANPYRGDNQLITDLPEWWVQAFLDAGFCWGGLWIGSKDAMHFAWQGPAFSGITELPLPYAPLTTAKPIRAKAAEVPVIPQPLAGTTTTVLADADGNGAIDVIRLSTSADGLIVDASVASRGHNACSARRSVVTGLGSVPSSAHASGFGDWDGRGGQDLWFVNDEGGRLELTVRWAFGGYAAETRAVTEVPTPSPSAWMSTGDFDADGRIDLFIIDDDTVNIWTIDPDTGNTLLLLETSNPHPGARHHMLGDENLDNRPDLWSIVGDDLMVSHAAEGFAPTARVHQPERLPVRILDSVMADYDGDGRVDLIAFDGRTKHVWLANTPLPDGLPLETWFEYPDAECGDNEPTWNRQDLRFSTSGWIAEGSYEWRSRAGFSAGCDPEDESCVIPEVTGTSLAEFMAWIDGLEPGTTNPSNAAAVAVEAAGYRLPCTADDEGCLGAPVLRAEVSSYFGQFLAERRGDVPPPHRWVLPIRIQDGVNRPR